MTTPLIDPPKTGPILAACVLVTAACAQSPASGNRFRGCENVDVLAAAEVIGSYGGTRPGFGHLAAVSAGRLVPIHDVPPGGFGDALAGLDDLGSGLTQLSTGTS